MSPMGNAVVTRIRFDVDRYQYFLYDLPGPPLELLLFDGTPRSMSWLPQPIYIEQPRLEPPDIWHLGGAAVLVMDDSVIEQLEPFISVAGELLPLYISGSGERFNALNILRDIDCLEPGTFALDDLELYPTFLEHRLPETGLFKIPQLDTTEIFHVERADDDASFRSLVQERAFRGIEFDVVWSSRDGAASLNLFFE